MPVNLTGIVAARMEEANEEALEIIGNYAVARMRQRAPVRKHGHVPRKKYTKSLGYSLAARRYVRAVAASGRLNKVESQKFRFAILHGQVQVPRRARNRQPLVLGKYGKDKAIHMTDEQTIRMVRKGGSAGKYREIAKSHKVPYARQFKPARGVEASTRFGKITPTGAFAARLGTRARSEIKAGKGVIVNAQGNFQYGGRLKESIEVIENNAHRVVIEADPVDENGHHYARYVEFPTSRTAAQPFMLPGLKDARKIVRQTFNETYRKHGLSRG